MPPVALTTRKKGKTSQKKGRRKGEEAKEAFLSFSIDHTHKTL